MEINGYSQLNKLAYNVFASISLVKRSSREHSNPRSAINKRAQVFEIVGLSQGHPLVRNGFTSVFCCENGSACGSFLEVRLLGLRQTASTWM